MLEQSVDHIRSLALFKHTRFLADQLEGGFDAEACQHLGHALSSIVALRQDVILCVKPENYVNRRGNRLGMSISGH